jgi:hypothetical protein
LSPLQAAAQSGTTTPNIWSGTPVLPRAGYDRLRDSLVSGSFVDPGTPFEIAVDNCLTEAVVAENLPPLN